MARDLLHSFPMTGKSRRNPPDAERIDDLRGRLLADQRLLFKACEDVEADLRFFEEERESELVERAQEEAAARLLHRLDDRGRAELEAIHAALSRIASGTYGICERCQTTVPLARLEAVPAAALCLSCEQADEKEAAARGRIR